MGSPLYLVVLICLTAIVESRECKKVRGVEGFSFEEFNQYQYNYVLVPNTEEGRTWRSAKKTGLKLYGKLFSAFTINKFDDTQVNNNYAIERTDGYKAFESVLDRGQKTGVTLTKQFYAYVPKKYVQFYVCPSIGQGAKLRDT
uniref:Vitellogenin domain-containing protein n=1 Tax=Clastoptera arizonana TaxID=38151 RepID=A0A1B6D6R7_9HEMI